MRTTLLLTTIALAVLALAPAESAVVSRRASRHIRPQSIGQPGRSRVRAVAPPPAHALLPILPAAGTNACGRRLPSEKGRVRALRTHAHELVMTATRQGPD
jgi:hypothetical protein